MPSQRRNVAKTGAYGVRFPTAQPANHIEENAYGFLMTPNVYISQVRRDSVAQSLLVRGWIDRPELVSQIVFEVGGQQTKAVLGTRRTDVQATHPEIETVYCGFEAEMRAVERATVTMTVYDARRAPIRTLSIKDKPSPPVSADERYRIAARIHEPQLDRLTVLLATETALPSYVEMVLDQQQVRSLRELPPRSAKSLYASENSIRYSIASFAISTESNVSNARLHLRVGRRTFEFLDPPEVVVIPSFAIRTNSVEYFRENSVLRVVGETDSASVSSVRVLVAGRLVGAAATFCDPRVTVPTEARSHFYVECLCDLGEETIIQLEALVGDDTVGFAEARVARRATTGPKLPGGPSSSGAYGAVLYNFQCGEDRSELPWIAIYSGLSAWPSIGGGSARTYSLAAHLRASGYRVLIIALGETGSHEWVPLMREYCDTLVLARTEPAGAKSGHIDLSTYRRSDGAATRVLRTIEAVFAPKAFIVNFAFNMYGALDLDTPIVLDAHDVQHKRSENARLNGGNLEDRRCTKEEERHLLSTAHSILAITEADATELEALESGRPVIVVPHAQLVFDPPPVTPESLRQLFFVGQKYAPNVAGIRAFIERVWPPLRSARPDMELHIAGRVCEEIEDLTQPGITLHGVVPSLDELYRNCGIVLNPVPYGTGLKIKSVEGLSSGRCVVATPEGTRGLPEDAPLIRAPLEGFLKAILDLNADPDAAAEMAADAVRFSERAFGPKHAYAALEEHLAKLDPPKSGAALISGATLAGYRICGTDIDLTFDLPEGPQRRCLSVNVGHAGRRIFRVSRLVVGAKGVVRFRVPLPLWLDDGENHKLNISWDEGVESSIWIRVRREDFGQNRPLMPNWAAHVGGRDEIELIDPPLRLDRSILSPSRQRIKVYDVRHRFRFETQAQGWVPTPLPRADGALTYLKFSRDISKGDQSDLLGFHDRETGLFEFEVTRGRLANLSQVASVPVDRSLRAVDPYWQRDWPLRIGAGGGISVTSLAPIAPPESDSARIERLVAVLQPQLDLSRIALVFPPDSPEEEVVRWSVFLDGAPQAMMQDVEFQRDRVLTSHRAELKRGEVLRFELRFASALSCRSARTRPIRCQFQ